MLTLSEVLSSTECAEFVRLLDNAPLSASPMLRPSGAGQALLVPDAKAKLRSDIVLDSRRPAAMFLTGRFAERVLPEVRRQFGIQLSGLEQWKVTRYPVGGHFAEHRDNTTPDAAHRRIAVSLFLGSDGEDWNGGRLFFPEIDLAASSARGSAVLFDCSLLHLVEPVAAGQRDVIVNFFW